MKLKFAALAILATAAALPVVVHAEDAPSTSFNIGAVTDYRYRGISQSRLKPALQGGIDYSNPNGLYLGTWASTINWIKDAGKITGTDTGSANLEVDLYGGYKGELSKGVAYDVGGLYYWYPSNKYKNIGGTSSADTFELYGALTYGVFTAKYSHSLTNLFGTGGNGAPNSKGSGYLDLSATFDLGNGYSVAPHVGHQEVHHYSMGSYNDVSLTLGKDLGNGVSLSAALVATDTKSIAGNPNGYAYYSPAGKNLGKTMVVLGAKYSF